jgi:hypothetical protein
VIPRPNIEDGNNGGENRTPNRETNCEHRPHVPFGYYRGVNTASPALASA